MWCDLDERCTSVWKIGGGVEKCSKFERVQCNPHESDYPWFSVFTSPHHRLQSSGPSHTVDGFSTIHFHSFHSFTLETNKTDKFSLLLVRCSPGREAAQHRYCRTNNSTMVILNSISWSVKNWIAATKARMWKKERRKITNKIPTLYDLMTESLWWRVLFCVWSVAKVLLEFSTWTPCHIAEQTTTMRGRAKSVIFNVFASFMLRFFFGFTLFIWHFTTCWLI